jgi:hypothetical protein
MYGLDVCDPCRVTPAARVSAWATLHLEERWERVRSNRSSTLMQIISAIARSDVVLPDVSLHHEQLGWLRRLFAREVQVGDPLFDDTVWVATGDTDATARLLASEGVQSAVLEAVTMPAELRLHGKEVFIRCASALARPPGEVGVLILSILHHARVALA